MSDEAPELPARGLATLGDYVTTVETSTGGRWAAGSLAGDAVIGRGEEVVALLAEHPLGVLTTSWSPDGERLVVGGQDGITRWWSADGGAVGEPLAASGWVSVGRWAPDGGCVALAAGSEVIIADASGRLVARHLVPATVTDLVWAGPDRLGAAAYGGVWWFDSDGETVSRLERQGALLSLALSPDGRWLAAGQQEKVVCLWDLETGREQQTTGYELKVEHLAWDPTGGHLAVGQYGEITVWNFTRDHRGAPPRHLVGHTHRVTALRPGPGGLVASGAADGSICIWRLTDDRPLVAASHVGGDVSCLAWFPDGRGVMGGTADGGVWRVDLEGAVQGARVDLNGAEQGA